MQHHLQSKRRLNVNGLITLHAKLSGTVYCNQSCLWVCLCVCVGLLPR